jgi:prepilin-type N-terminal cleavage/methylation domain-containing protein
MKKEGFTLVELLAVIVILANILSIAVPDISKIIRNTTNKAFESDVKMLIKAIEYKILEDDSFNITSIDIVNLQSELDVSADNYLAVDVELVNEEPYVTVVGKEKWIGLTAFGTLHNLNVTSTASIYLATLQLGTLQLSPTFNSNTFSYTTTSTVAGIINVKPTSENPSATIYVNGISTPSGMSKSVSLELGPNEIIIKVEDKTTGLFNEYKVIVNRNP